MTKPIIYSLSQMRGTDFPVPHPIVQGVLSESETILLIGRPKIGKSRLAQQMTVSLSRGEPFLGHEIDGPHRVLYLDLENRPSGVKTRFTAMSEPHPGDNLIHVYAPETLAENAFVASNAGIVALADAITEFRPDVLVIDPWRLFVGGDGNKEDVVMNGLKVLSELRTKHPRLATILIHHLRKQQEGNRVTLRHDPSAWVESASGHYALIGHSDATYGLERERSDSGEELIVFGGVARTAPAPMLLLDEDEETLLFSVATGADALERLLTPKEQEIWTVAGRLERFTYTELVSAAKTTNKKVVSSTLRKAEKAGLVVQDGKTYRVQGAVRTDWGRSLAA